MNAGGGDKNGTAQYDWLPATSLTKKSTYKETCPYCSLMCNRIAVLTSTVSDWANSHQSQLNAMLIDR